MDGSTLTDIVDRFEKIPLDDWKGVYRGMWGCKDQVTEDIQSHADGYRVVLNDLNFDVFSSYHKKKLISYNIRITGEDFECEWYDCKKKGNSEEFQKLNQIDTNLKGISKKLKENKLNTKKQRIADALK